MSTAADLALLRALVHEDAQAVRRALSSPAADVRRFLRFAHGDRLAGFAYGALGRLATSGILSPDLLATAKATALSERLRTDHLLTELRRLGQMIEGSGVRALFLKGPLFVRRFYRDQYARSAADLDLFVRARDLAAVEALLHRAGYVPQFRVVLSRRLSRYFVHHLEFRWNQIPLDVHWVFQRHFTFAIDYERVWNTTTYVELEGHRYEVVAAEYELVLQVLGIMTDLQVGKLKLRSLIDVHRVVQALDGSVDWNEFLARCARERILRPTVYVLALVLEMLDCWRDFPDLATAVSPVLERLPTAPVDASIALDSRPFSLRQKLLALRMYESPLAASICWWLLSLPFRVAMFGITRSTHEPRELPA
jgi:hypothetical protein